MTGDQCTKYLESVAPQIYRAVCEWSKALPDDFEALEETRDLLFAQQQKHLDRSSLIDLMSDSEHQKWLLRLWTLREQGDAVHARRMWLRWKKEVPTGLLGHFEHVVRKQAKKGRRG